MDLDARSVIYKKFRRYRILWIIGAVPIAMLSVGLLVGVFIDLRNLINDGHLGGGLWLRMVLVVLAVVPILALIFGLICQFRRPYDFRSLRVFMALALLQFLLPIVFFFGFFAGFLAGMGGSMTFWRLEAASNVWVLFICFELLMCLAIVALSIVFCVIRGVSLVQGTNMGSGDLAGFDTRSDFDRGV